MTAHSHDCHDHGAHAPGASALSLAAIVTGSTCGFSCWYAREDVCRCSCGGRNHGILLKDGAEQPERERRVRGVRYTLAAVYEGLSDAQDAAELIAGPARLVGSGSEAWVSGALYSAATASQVKNWPELSHFADANMRNYRTRPYTVWTLAEPEKASPPSAGTVFNQGKDAEGRRLRYDGTLK